MIRKMLAVGALCVASSGAWAVDGNQLHKFCVSDDPLEVGFCLGYAMGVSDGQRAQLDVAKLVIDELQSQNLPVAHEILQQAMGHCPPNNVTQGQVMDVVRVFLEARPSARHHLAGYLVHTALREAFPCPK